MGELLSNKNCYKLLINFKSEMEWTNLSLQEPLSPRSSHIAGLLQDKNKNLELVVLFGGRRGNVSNDSWALNCITKTWRQIDNIHTAPSISSAYACVASAPKIFIFGGMVKESDDFCATNRLLEYNHEEEAITVLEPKENDFTPPPLISATMIHHKRFLYVYGGMDHLANVSNRLYIYDLHKKTWSSSNAKNAPAGRFGHSLNLWVKRVSGEEKESFLIVYGGCLGKDKDMKNSGDILIYSIGIYVLPFYFDRL